MNHSERPEVEEKHLREIAEQVIRAAIRTCNQKGWGGFITPHETLGIVAEEYHELIDAVKSNSVRHVNRELTDIAVAAIFALAGDLSERTREEEEEAALARVEELLEPQFTSYEDSREFKRKLSRYIVANGWNLRERKPQSEIYWSPVDKQELEIPLFAALVCFSYDMARVISQLSKLEMTDPENIISKILQEKR